MGLVFHPLDIEENQLMPRLSCRRRGGSEQVRFGKLAQALGFSDFWIFCRTLVKIAKLRFPSPSICHNNTHLFTGITPNLFAVILQRKSDINFRQVWHLQSSNVVSAFRPLRYYYLLMTRIKNWLAMSSHKNWLICLYMLSITLLTSLLMFPTNPAAQVGPASSQPHTPPRQPLPNVPRPLRREGAFCFQGLTPAEQAMEEAMMASSSPPPESVLGKRRRSVGEPVDGGDTEPDEQGLSTTRPQSELPSITNVAATVLRYATTKKLRPEQRDEVDAFLLVSIVLLQRLCLFYVRPWLGHYSWPTGQVVYMCACTRE